MPNQADGAVAKRGDDTRPLGTDELTEDQRRAIARFEALLAQHTGQTSGTGQGANDPFVGPGTFEAKPLHRVILFDGKRGTGKTATMLSALAKLVEEPDRAGGARSPAPHLALTPVSFDDVPDDTHAFAFLATAIARVVDWLAARDGVPTACERRELQRQFRPLCETTLGWGRPGHDGRSLADVVAEQLEADKGWHGLRARWRAFLDLLFRDLEATGRLTSGGLLLMPIDDLDLQPGRARELLLAMRMISHPRLIYVMTGDSQHLGDLLSWEIEGELRERTRLGADGPESLRERAVELGHAQLLKAIPPSNTVPLPLWSLATFVQRAIARLKLEAAPPNGGRDEPDTVQHEAGSHLRDRHQMERAAQLLEEHRNNPRRAKHGLTARRSEAIWDRLEQLDASDRNDPVRWRAIAFALLAEDWRDANPRRQLESSEDLGARATAEPSLEGAAPGIHMRPSMTWRAGSGDGQRGKRLDEVGQMLAAAAELHIRPRPTLAGIQLDPGTFAIDKPGEVFCTSQLLRETGIRAIAVPRRLEDVLVQAFADEKGLLDATKVLAVVAGRDLLGQPGSSELTTGIARQFGSLAAARMAADPTDSSWALMLWLAAPESGIHRQTRREIVLGWQLEGRPRKLAHAIAQATRTATQQRENHLSGQISRRMGGSEDASALRRELDGLDAVTNEPGVWALLHRQPGPSVLSWSTDGVRALGTLLQARTRWREGDTYHTLAEWLGVSRDEGFYAIGADLEPLGKNLLAAQDGHTLATRFTESLSAALKAPRDRTVAQELHRIFEALAAAFSAGDAQWKVDIGPNGELVLGASEANGAGGTFPELAILARHETGVPFGGEGALRLCLPQAFEPRFGEERARGHAAPLLLVAFDLLRAQKMRSRAGVDAATPSEVDFEQPMAKESSERGDVSIPWPSGMAYREAAAFAESLREFWDSPETHSTGNPIAERRSLLIAIVQIGAAILGARTAPGLVAVHRYDDSLLDSWQQILHQGAIDSEEHRFGKWLRSAAWENFLESDPAFLEAFRTRPGASR